MYKFLVFICRISIFCVIVVVVLGHAASLKVLLPEPIPILNLPNVPTGFSFCVSLALSIAPDETFLSPAARDCSVDCAFWNVVPLRPASIVEPPNFFDVDLDVTLSFPSIWLKLASEIPLTVSNVIYFLRNSKQ